MDRDWTIRQKGELTVTEAAELVGTDAATIIAFLDEIPHRRLGHEPDVRAEGPILVLADDVRDWADTR